MLSQILNTLQSVLIPVIVALLVVGAGLVWWVGRPRKGDRPELDRARPDPARAPATRRVPSVQPVPSAQPAPSVQPRPPAASAPPLAPQPPPAAPAAPAAAPLAPLVADLLLVDDSAVVRAKLRRLFEPAGYRVALARDGQEALQLLAQGRYALMVTDLEMPNLDGVGLINAVQGQPALAQMPIMAITGHDDLQARLDECREICGIYRKPWIDDDLLGHVQMLVGSRSAHTAQAQDH
ncbi:MAG: hypothetical protein A3E25_01160 [Burkholderiales bacterium RIFCSPHIGHO2_12_FULL_69_20]|nr:MAG: hypothetical protein A3E25_01160 [Burkholderiales bacterium RIFCSPHIGHO2_12_FULL_69_20]